MRLIGLTGSIACGKSTVSSDLARRGYAVIDGDQVARELTSSGGAAVGAVRAGFGNQYILPDGSMNRREMGKLVFSDPRAREKLDQILAPFLREQILQRVGEVRQTGAPLCFLDLPLLYEKGYDRICDTVWCVWLPEDLQLQRIMERDGFSREESLSRMRAVLSSDEKANLSPVVIDNSGSVGDTLLQVDAQLEKELERASAPVRRKRSAAPAEGSVPGMTAERSVPAGQPEVFSGFDRPEASRKQPSRRKVSWRMPRLLTVALSVCGALLIVAFTAQMLMNGYLTRRAELHQQEQQSINAQYPIGYVDLIQSGAAEFNLSPALVASVIRNESSFRASAESDVGARGLMQLMPDTAEWIAGKLHVEDYRFDQMYEPASNIRFGCWYLNYLSSLFGGNPLSVACAYHAGQGQVRTWLGNPLYSSDGNTLIQDHLPEGPTKTYAGRVTRDYGIYQAKYFQAASADADAAAVP